MMDWIQSFYDAIVELSEKPSLTDWVQAASAACIVILTCFQACINRRMWKVSQRQARDLKESVVATRQSADAAIAALRPWIPYPEMKVVDGLTYGDEGASFCIEITVKNTGKSPATNVHIDYEVRVASAKPNVDVLPRINELKKAGHTGGYTMFPGDIIHKPEKFAISMDDIERARPRKALIPVIFICIGYDFAREPERHFTAFNTDLTRKREGKRGGQIAGWLDFDVEYTADELYLTSPLGSGYAD